ncbi:MAG: NTP transferase domain-containing protein [Gammaproteobacteria bacterium]|nr:NTP transferase domain-containing protein [Gammaproteobacteria bacterium]
MNIEHAVISAAGLGSRLGLDIPKCLVELEGHSLIYYLLQLLKDVRDVRIVVGFKEQEVIDYVRAIRRDVTFVRNPNYAHSSNAYSLHLATRHLDAPFLSIDGDMYVEPESFVRFVDACANHRNLIGISKSFTEEAVFVELDQHQMIQHFRRDPPGAYEWCGIAYFSDLVVSPGAKFVYNEIENMLPVAAEIVDVFEIDTPQDLDYLYRNFNREKQEEYFGR